MIKKRRKKPIRIKSNRSLRQHASLPQVSLKQDLGNFDPNIKISKQAALINIEKIPNAQRQAVFSQIGRVQGNRNMQRLLDADGNLVEKKSSGDQKGTERVIERIDGRGQIALQRQEAVKTGEPALEKNQKVIVDGNAIGTYRDSVFWFLKRYGNLVNQISEFNKANEIAPASLTSVGAEALTFIKWNIVRWSEPVSDSDMEALINWGEDYVEAMKEADEKQERIAIDRIWEIQKQIFRAEEKLEELRPQLRELQRSAFRRGSESGLKKITDTTALILDSLLVAKEWVEEATTTTKDITYLGTTLRTQKALHGWKQPWNELMVTSRNARVGKILSLSDKINKVFAAYQLLDEGLSLLSPGKTASDKGSKGIAFAATLASAGGTLIGASNFFSLYNNFYIGPMTARILEQIEGLKDQISTGINRPLIQLGKFDMVDWDLEPGGREMFDFMHALMQTSNPDRLPDWSADVLKYFLRYRSEFNAGALGEWDMPTKDPSMTKRWVFRHRADVWGMLYGNVNVP